MNKSQGSDNANFTNHADGVVQIAHAHGQVMVIQRSDVGPQMAKVLDLLPAVCHDHAFELRKQYSARRLQLTISQGALRPDLNSGRLVRCPWHIVVGDYVFGGMMLALCLPFLVMYSLLFAAALPSFDAASGTAFLQVQLVIFVMVAVYYCTIWPQLKAAEMLR